jgi:hypothetical protein
MTAYSQWKPAQKEGFALKVMTSFLVGWIVVCLTIAGFQIVHHGYGSGIGDGNYLPPEVSRQFHREDLKTPQELMDATSR